LIGPTSKRKKPDRLAMKSDFHMKISISTALAPIIFSLLIIAGCRSTSKAPATGSPYVKIYVSKTGEITMDGKAATLDELGRAFSDLAKRHGVVLYTRDSHEMFESHPIANKVMDLVVHNQLPIRLCMNKDFSDAFGPDGKLLVGK
jgi:hypothetical protein